MMGLVVFIAIIILFCIAAIVTATPVDQNVPCGCKDCLYYTEETCTNELSDYYGCPGWKYNWCDLGIKRPEESA